MFKNAYLFIVLTLLATQSFAQARGSMSSGGSQYPSIIIMGKAAATLAEASEFDHVSTGNFVTCGLDQDNNPYCEVLTTEFSIDITSNSISVTVYGYAAEDLSALSLNAGGDSKTYKSTGISCGNEVTTSGNKTFCKLEAYIIKNIGANIID